MKIGDIVVRKSYNKDIKFKIVDIKNIDDKEVFISTILNFISLL